jgi:predicted small metal-binding protein
MKQFACASVVEGCPAKFEADSEEELFGQIADHAREVYGLDEVPPELMEQVKAKIVDA